MRFSPRAGDATISKKLHHHRKQEIARVAAALKTTVAEYEKVRLPKFVLGWGISKL